MYIFGQWEEAKNHECTVYAGPRKSIHRSLGQNSDLGLSCCKATMVSTTAYCKIVTCLLECIMHQFTLIWKKKIFQCKVVIFLTAQQKHFFNKTKW